MFVNSLKCSSSFNPRYGAGCNLKPVICNLFRSWFNVSIPMTGASCNGITRLFLLMFCMTNGFNPRYGCRLQHGASVCYKALLTKFQSPLRVRVATQMRQYTTNQDGGVSIPATGASCNLKKLKMIILLLYFNPRDGCELQLQNLTKQTTIIPSIL